MRSSVAIRAAIAVALLGLAAAIHLSGNGMHETFIRALHHLH